MEAHHIEALRRQRSADHRRERKNMKEGVYMHKYTSKDFQEVRRAPKARNSTLLRS